MLLVHVRSPSGILETSVLGWFLIKFRHKWKAQKNIFVVMPVRTWPMINIRAARRQLVAGRRGGGGGGWWMARDTPWLGYPFLRVGFSFHDCPAMASICYGNDDFCYVAACSDIVRDAEKSIECRRASPERVGVGENGRRGQTSAWRRVIFALQCNKVSQI